MTSRSLLLLGTQQGPFPSSSHLDAAFRGQQSLGSWLPWSQPHAVTPQIKEDPPGGFCKRWNLMNPWLITRRKEDGKCLTAACLTAATGYHFLVWWERRVCEFDCTAVTKTHLRCDRSLVSTREKRGSEKQMCFRPGEVFLSRWGRSALSAASQTFSWL